MPHVLTITEAADGPNAVKPKSMSVIGLLCTADAGVGTPALERLTATFPPNKPVLVTNLRAAINNAGTIGTLKGALQAIADIGSPYVVVVRVVPGADAAATTTALIGSIVNNAYTGMKAFLTSKIRPNYIGCPGLDVPAVTAEMVILAQQLKTARVYAQAAGDTEAAALLDRDNYAARELTLIWPEFTAVGGMAKGEAVARALAIRAKVTEEQGPQKTISNVVVDGVSGITKDVFWDLQDPTTPAALLNDGGIVTLIHANGCRFWGNRTCSDDANYAFESAVLVNHKLRGVIASVVTPFMDQPMTVALVKSLIETMNAEGRAMVRAGELIGVNFSYEAEDNDATALAQGKPVFRYTFTPPAPFENPEIVLQITDTYYAGFAEQLI